MDEAAQFGDVSASLPGNASVLKVSPPGESQAAARTVTSAGFSEQFFAVCVLTLSTTAFVNLFPGESGLEFEEQGNPILQVLWIVLYVLMLFLVRKRVGELLLLLWRNKSLTLLLGWACVSVAWSIDRQVTIRHGVALMLCSLFGVYLGARFRLHEQLRLVATAIGIVVIASIGACLLFPSYGIQAASPFEEPAWQGVLSHKNTLGKIAVIATLILVLYLLKGVRRAPVFIGIIGLFFTILRTHAMTALVYFLLLVMAFPFVRAFQRSRTNRRVIVAVALLIFGGLASWTYFNWDNFTYSLGKDPELTGRFALWGLAVTWIADKPIVGHGLDAFWSDYYGPVADFRAASGWLAAPHAHNGFINLWLDLGVIGVFLFVASFVLTLRGALKLAATSKRVEGLWPLGFLVFYLFYSFSETTLLSRNDMLWILYVAIATQVRTPVFLASSAPRQVQ